MVTVSNQKRMLGVFLPVLVLSVFSFTISAAGVTRIMPLGDSITRGYFGSVYYWGYRKPLYDSLTGGSYNFDFVGSMTDPYTFPDPQHEGHDGWKADGILYGVRSWLDAHQPDVVLLHIGTNDITWEDEDANEVNDILNVIDDYEDDNNKHVTVILALIINRRIDSPPIRRSRTTQFNNDVNDMALNRIANGDDIIIVDMESALNYDIGVDMADEVHPNDNGYAKMAAVWYNALVGYFSRFDFTISGYVMETDGNTPVEGVLIDANNNGGSTCFTDANGYYEVVVDYNWSGKVTPTKYAYGFEPNSRAYAHVIADQNGQDYTGKLLAFIISGYIQNDCNVPVPVKGVEVSASAGGNSDITDANGYYEVWVDYNWAGTVTPSPAYYTFEPVNMVYTDVLADQMEQNYQAANIYDVDCDGTIGYGDVHVISINWLDDTAENICNFNGDSIVDFKDFAEFANVWMEEYEK
jgi:hypothetical protein